MDTLTRKVLDPKVPTEAPADPRRSRLAEVARKVREDARDDPSGTLSGSEVAAGGE